MGKRDWIWLLVVVGAGAAGFLAGRSTETPGRSASSREPVERAQPAAPETRAGPERPAPTPTPSVSRKGTVAPDEGQSAAELVADAVAFSKLFEREVDGPVMDGSRWGPDDPLPDGTTLDFPPGAHVWKTRGLEHREHFPRDLLVQGRGMNQTLVRIEEISTRDEVRGLTFRDLTIDCGNDYFTDLRRDKPVTIRLERCRIVGFDCGHGGSVMLAARTAGFYATDCEILAGYGSSPGSGNLFRVRSGLRVRMENCRIVGPFRSLFDTNREATYHFEWCDFTEIYPSVKRLMERQHAGVRFVDCTFRYLPGDREPSGKPKPLSDLNPAWK